MYLDGSPFVKSHNYAQKEKGNQHIEIVDLYRVVFSSTPIAKPYLNESSSHLEPIVILLTLIVGDERG